MNGGNCAKMPEVSFARVCPGWRRRLECLAMSLSNEMVMVSRQARAQDEAEASSACLSFQTKSFSRHFSNDFGPI